MTRPNARRPTPTTTSCAGSPAGREGGLARSNFPPRRGCALRRILGSLAHLEDRPMQGVPGPATPNIFAAITVSPPESRLCVRLSGPVAPVPRCLRSSWIDGCRSSLFSTPSQVARRQLPAVHSPAASLSQPSKTLMMFCEGKHHHHRWSATGITAGDCRRWFHHKRRSSPSAYLSRAAERHPGQSAEHRYRHDCSRDRGE